MKRTFTKTNKVKVGQGNEKIMLLKEKVNLSWVLGMFSSNEYLYYVNCGMRVDGMYVEPNLLMEQEVMSSVIGSVLKVLLIVILAGVFMSVNTVYSILLGVLGFSIGVMLLIYLGLEFIALGYLVVYIGAILVLFLFVVMLLETNKVYHVGFMNLEFIKERVFVEKLLFVLVVYKLIKDALLEVTSYNGYVYSELSSYLVRRSYVGNINVIGMYLYTYVYYLIIFSGLILLIAIIGGIKLTFLKKRSKAQVLQNQHNKLVEIELV